MDDKLYRLLETPLQLKSVEELKRRYDNSIHEFNEEDDNYIGVATANIRQFNDHGKELKAAHVSDSYVIEDRRREGIFSNLYTKLEEELQSQDVELFYSLSPTPYELLNLVDHQDYEILGEIGTYAKVMDSGKVVSGFMGKLAGLITKARNSGEKSVSYSGIDVFEMESYDGVDELYNSLKSELGFMSVRSKNWLDNRTKDRDYYNIGAKKDDKLSGYIIYKYIERADTRYFIVMDILFDDRKTLEAMYDELMARAKEKNISLIGIWANSRLNDFIRDKKFMYARSTFSLIAKGEGLTKDMSKWYIEPIEGEVY